MAVKRGKLFVVSGPSGAGKSTLSKMAVDFFSDLRFSISYTTRGPRPDETDGRDYRFVDQASFDRMAESGEFVEHARVHGKSYGTARADLDGMLRAGHDVLLDIDVQGAAQLTGSVRNAVRVFVLPPSIEECRRRLDVRGDVNPEHAEERLRTALEEIKEAGNYDYIIINRDVAESFDRLKSIITAERTRKEAVMDEVKRNFEIPRKGE